MICIICGGTGGARLARGFNEIYDPTALTYICNVGDNMWLFGLAICPDIDTIIYYLSGIADYDRVGGYKMKPSMPMIVCACFTQSSGSG